jgi:hypothetical protein
MHGRPRRCLATYRGWCDGFLHAEKGLATVEQQANRIEQVLERLDKLEALLTDLLQRGLVKDWYSTEEAAAILGKAKFTVREWCRLGRVRCRKKNTGRGKHQSWVIAHEEILRIQREGLLPLDGTSSSAS